MYVVSSLRETLELRGANTSPSRTRGSPTDPYGSTRVDPRPMPCDPGRVRVVRKVEKIRTDRPGSPTGGPCDSLGCKLQDVRLVITVKLFSLPPTSLSPDPRSTSNVPIQTSAEEGALYEGTTVARPEPQAPEGNVFSLRRGSRSRSHGREGSRSKAKEETMAEKRAVRVPIDYSTKQHPMHLH